jgi:hypothetical protein
MKEGKLTEANSSTMDTLENGENSTVIIKAHEQEKKRTNTPRKGKKRPLSPPSAVNVQGDSYNRRESMVMNYNPKSTIQQKSRKRRLSLSSSLCIECRIKKKKKTEHLSDEKEN